MARDFDALMAGEDEGATLRAALRFVAWGGIAASAIAIAVLAARTDSGAQRLAHILSGPTSAAADSPIAQTPTALAARLAEAETEAGRLRDTVRRLTADRDLVIARLEALERNLDTTASIRESTPSATPVATPTTVPAATPPQADPAAAPAAPPAPAVPAQAAPVPTAPVAPAQAKPAPSASMLAPDPLIPATASPAPLAPVAASTAPVRMATTTPTPTAAAPPATAEQANLGAIAGPAAESIATRTEFGVDLGGDRTVDALRAMWTSLRTGKHGAVFEGLRPLVAVREGGKSGGVELRLVVGPLANAVAAARLCGSLAAAGLACQPTVFDGQRLAVR